MVLGWSAASLGYTEEARQVIDRAIELSPDDPYVLDTYGMLLLKNGDTLRGHRMIQRAAKQLPDDITIQLHLGRSLVQLKQFAEAKSVLSALVNKASDGQIAQEAKVLLDSIPPSIE